MKRILIVGDSWAIIPCNIWAPQCLYSRDNEQHRWVSTDPNILNWLDFQLLARGHSVSNRSWGGNANWFHLGIADTFMEASVKNNFHIDIVIWFHTELLRDMHLDYNISRNKHLAITKEKGLDGIIDYIAEETYSYARKIHEISPTTKWAIIGGHAAVSKKHEHMLDFADFYIRDLRKQMTGIDFPECHTLSFREHDWEQLKNNYNMPLEVILEELNKKKFTHDNCKDLELFYDEVHPSPKANMKLTEQIIKHFDL